MPASPAITKPDGWHTGRQQEIGDRLVLYRAAHHTGGHGPHHRASKPIQLANRANTR